jgi:hypothetical protein
MSSIVLNTAPSTCQRQCCRRHCCAFSWRLSMPKFALRRFWAKIHPMPAPVTSRKRFVLGFHTCAPDCVGVLTFYSGDVVVSWDLALEALVVDIVATRETVAEIHMLLDRVGVRDSVPASTLLAALCGAVLVGVALLGAIVSLVAIVSLMPIVS